MPRVLLIAIVLAGFAATPGSAQFVQYTAPGTLAQTAKTAAESAKQGSENARWSLGRIGLEPRFAVRDFGYYQNVFASSDEATAVDDVRGTIGAGLAAYLNLGSKSLLTSYVAPEYSWWQDQSDLSQLNVSWGVGWFGFFNNLTTTANVSLTDRERPLSNEVDAPVRVEEERQQLRAELSLTDALGIIASATSAQTRHGNDVDPFVPGLTANALDRDSETVSAAITLTVRRWILGVGLESTHVDLLVDSEGRSSKGDSPFAQLEYGSDRIDLELTAIDRRVDFVNPDLGRNQLTAGGGRLGLKITPTMALNLYAARSLALAALETNGIIVQTREGVSLATELGSRFELTVIAESGESDFRDPEGSSRRDDLEVLAATLLYELPRDLVLRFYVRDTTWDSNLAAFDRFQRTIGVNLELGRDLSSW